MPDFGLPATPDELAKLYLHNRDVPCPGCGYNLRNATAARCPECAYRLQLGPSVPDTIACSRKTLPRLALSLLGCSFVSMLYLGDYITRYMSLPPHPIRSTLEFAFTSFFLASICASFLCIVFVWRWFLAARTGRRSTRLLTLAMITYHATFALFLLLAWLETR